MSKEERDGCKFLVTTGGVSVRAQGYDSEEEARATWKYYSQWPHEHATLYRRVEEGEIVDRANHIHDVKAEGEAAIKAMETFLQSRAVPPDHPLLNSIKTIAGRKDDTGKLRYSLLPAGTVEQILEVLEFGAVKYAPDNWKKVPGAFTRYYDAAIRHLVAGYLGNTKDSESGYSHFAHAGCCILFLLWLERNPGKELIDITHQVKE